MPKNLKLAVLALISATAAAQTPFEKSVTPILANTCKACHNEQLASGGLSVTPLLDPTSLTKFRETWELVVDKLRSGEMPPKGIPRPPQ